MWFLRSVEGLLGCWEIIISVFGFCTLVTFFVLWDVSRILAGCFLCTDTLIGKCCCRFLCAIFLKCKREFLETVSPSLWVSVKVCTHIISGKIIMLGVSTLFLVMPHVNFGNLKCFKVVVGYPVWCFSFFG